ncbi:MAG: permease [Blastochloris sp.]|jgi:uncharacterized membrane protein YraQ (UPF0718 family)|nr:permease [Blastochloris sp.]
MLPHLPEITLIFTSLFIQGLPFLFLGALISGLVSSFLPIEKLIAWMPRHPLKSACLGLCAGLVFPSCECIGLPLVRRLTRKGLPLSAGLAYLFAGPAINPIALSSTWLAFSFEDPITAICLRLIGAILIALILALSLHRMGRTWVLRPEVLATTPTNEHLTQSPVIAASWLQARFPRLANAVQITLVDFLNVSLFYIFGALIAATVQTMGSTFLNQTGTGLLGIPLMMLAAILSSVCSSADAFVAKSYVNVSLAATFAFLWIGPVLDLKLIVIYHSFFQRRAIVLLTILTLVSVFLLALALSVIPADYLNAIYWSTQR